MQIKIPAPAYKIIGAGLTAGVLVFLIASGLRFIAPSDASGSSGKPTEGAPVNNNFYGAVTIVESLSPIKTERPAEIAQGPTINGNCNAVGMGNNVNCAPPSRAPDDAVSNHLIQDFRATGSYKIPITAVMGDQEAFQYATKLADILKMAGWTIDGVNQSIYTAPMMGLLVSMGPQNGRVPGGTIHFQDLPPAAAALIKVFRENGIAFLGNVDSNIRDANETQLIVGGRP
jgi:hypothetical protein